MSDKPEIWKEGESVYGRFVDVSSNGDFSVEAIIEKKADGTFVVVSVNVIPKEEA